QPHPPRSLLFPYTTLFRSRVTDPTPPNSPVVQIVSSPDTVTLDPDQTQQFVAYGRTQAGDSVAVAVSWSASGGTITSGGLYTARSEEHTSELQSLRHLVCR